MDVCFRAQFITSICVILFQTCYSYNYNNHPCCMEPRENVTLAMLIDAFEIYGHDPSDKLDNLWLYQNEMMRIKTAEDQYKINERVHIATDHLSRFIRLHVKELKVLLIALDDVIDNMLTMYENHNSIAAVRKAISTNGPVPMEFYVSQEFYCGKNVYIFLSETYSDIYNMGREVAPYCKDCTFYFLGFFHGHDDSKYYLLDDPSIAFPTDNYLHGLECNNGVCIYRFPFKKILQRDRDVITLPKAIVKCGLITYKLPPLSAASCIITSGSFILDFNIQGLRYRHYDYLLIIPNGNAYYTKETGSPLLCHHHVCEWNYTNPYGGPFSIPGEPVEKVPAIPPFVETTTKQPMTEDNTTIEYELEGCLFVYPPNYGSIAGKSYLDKIRLHDNRFRCNTGLGDTKGLYWYPQWLGPSPHQTYSDDKAVFDPPLVTYEVPPGGVYSAEKDDFDDVDID